ncbi:MarR family winged helix-turn-helix transcriptional regulator [Paenibacillus sp. NFR01]|uniref:MarR family winged helix-turn-helix transcriptional regulator n=1 Tax=Paenibacillus sp. NFR01 TaxID=1566279 RepID=UPI0008C6C8DE|nr:DNA-binding transcriptional regulator, MarR family [Paenibacillus sp. NFR01]
MDKTPLYTPYSDLFRDIGMEIRNLANQRLSELGLNVQQGQMIDYIFHNEEKGVIQKDLAERFSRTGATITSMLQGLEKKGYLKRVIPENNERQKRIHLLPKGADLVGEFNEIFSGVENRIVQGLTESEARVLKELLMKVKGTLRGENR